jgi:hypothetical protein
VQRGEGADDGVEALVRELEPLGVRELHVHLPADPLGSGARELEHFRAELDRGQRDPIRIEGKISPAADRDFQHVAARLRAGPLAAAGEQYAVEEVHLAVVAGRLLIDEVADALGLGPCVRRAHGLGSSECRSPPRRGRRRCGAPQVMPTISTTSAPIITAATIHIRLTCPPEPSLPNAAK